MVARFLPPSRPFPRNARVAGSAREGTAAHSSDLLTEGARLVGYLASVVVACAALYALS